jgi:hypothetical protein
MRIRFWLVLLVAAAWLTAGCVLPGDQLGPDDDSHGDDDAGDDDTGDDDTEPYDICDDAPGEIVCDSNTAVYCDAHGDVDYTDECDGAAGEFCLWGTGCVFCYPGTSDCDGLDVLECLPDGSGYTVVDTCIEEQGEVCSNGECVQLCDVAEQTDSTIGCKFFAIDTDQHDMGPESIQYAVALSNVHETLTATASIETINGGVWTAVWSDQVGPRQLTTVNLNDAHVDDTAIHDEGAYRIISNIPIIAYQFNPVNGASSYLSDASLLLPVSAYDSVYRIPGWRQAMDNTGTIQHSSLNVVASVDNTTVVVTPSISTLGGGSVAAGGPQAPVTVHLDQGDYLQIASNQDQAALAGTLIETAQATPVAVFAGHECALIPTSECCCDHLEEQIFGIQTWGESYVAARIPHRGPPVEDCLWQVVAGNDPVTLTFDAHGDVTGLPGSTSLGAGEVLEFWVSGSTTHPGDFTVTGTDAFLLTQYMISAGASPDPNLGDPAMVQTVPVEQYLDAYVVLVPSTWQNDYMIITRPVGTVVTIDGTSIDSWPQWAESAVIGSGGGFEAVRVLVPDGVHELEGGDLFGVVVVGFDTHDSYAYPGGLNQQRINDL